MQEALKLKSPLAAIVEPLQPLDISDDIKLIAAAEIGARRQFLRGKIREKFPLQKGQQSTYDKETAGLIRKFLLGDTHLNETLVKIGVPDTAAEVIVERLTHNLFRNFGIGEGQRTP